VALLTADLRLHGRFVWVASAIYLLTGVVSAVESKFPSTGLKHMLGETYLFLLFLISAHLAASAERLRVVAIAWITGTALASLVAFATVIIFYSSPQSFLLPYLTYHHGSVPAGNFPRVTAMFASASLFFNYASVGIVLLLCCRRIQLIHRSVFWILFAAICIAAVFTFSIGLGSFFLIAGVFWLKNQPRSEAAGTGGWILSLASIAWLILAFVALEPYPEAQFNFALPGAGLHIYPSARFLVWQDTIETIRNNFFLGVGPGIPVCDVIFTNTDTTKSLLTDAHNTFLNVLAERGIFGVLAFIITLSLIIRPDSLFVRCNSENPIHLLSRGLRFSLLIAFVYQGMVGSFEDAKHLWVLMGIALAASKVSPNSDKNEEQSEAAPI
jgi:O-antigen ligase